MKYLIDTNVLISAFVFGGAPRQLLLKLLRMGETVYISKFVDDEFRAKLMEKWPGKADRVYALYRQLSFNFCTKRVTGVFDEQGKQPVAWIRHRNLPPVHGLESALPPLLRRATAV